MVHYLKRNTKLAILVFLFIQSLGLLSFAGIASQWYESLDMAKIESENSGKPIFVYFGADWCGPCQHFKKTIANNAAFLNYADENLILLFGDLTSRDPSQNPKMYGLAQELGVRSIPRLVMLNSEGKKIKSKVRRAGDAHGMIDIIDKTVQSHKSNQEILALPIIGWIVSEPIGMATALGTVLLLGVGFVLLQNSKQQSDKQEYADQLLAHFPSPETHGVVIMGELQSFTIEGGQVLTDLMNFSLHGSIWLQPGEQLKLVSGTVLEFKPFEIPQD